MARDKTDEIRNLVVTPGSVPRDKNDDPDLDPFPGRVVDALQAVLREYDPSPDEITRWAENIVATAILGAEDEAPRNRPASAKQTERQLVKFHKLCGELADFVADMNRPAVDGLHAEGFNAFALATALRAAQEQAQCAFGSFEAGPLPSGRPSKLQATDVTRLCAGVFVKITGRRPTFTTSPATGEISGLWPDTLGAVFKALHIDAKVSHQVRKLQKEIPAEKWVLSDKNPPWEA